MNLDDLLALLRGQVVKIKLEIEISIVSSPDAAQPGQPDYIAKCDYCEWTRRYDNSLSAKRAMSAHLAHCQGFAEATGYIAEMRDSKGQP